MDDSVNQTGDLLDRAAEALLNAATPLMAAAQAQAAAAATPLQAAQQQAAAQALPPIPLAPGYVYQPQTPQQAAQQQAQQQQYPPGGTPAWPQTPAPTPMQAAQQQAGSAGPTPGDLALAAARATPLAAAQQQAAGGGAADAFGAALRSAAASLLIMKAAVTQTADTLLSFGAKASPQAAATLTGSFDLLQARIGTFLLPAMDEMARAAQIVARNLPDADRPRSFLGGASLSDVARPGPHSLVGMINRFSGDDTELARSYAGLPAARQGSHEAAYDRLQQAALNQDPIQTEIMREQLKNMEKMVGLLQDRGGRGGPGASLEVNFR